MFKMNKLLGQNFLTSREIAEDIVNAADVGLSDIILEVGPGKGILTELLIEKAKKVIAVEKDKRLIDFLKEEFKEEIKNKKIELIYGDVLKFPKGVSLRIPKETPLGTYKIVANIPYYITSRFLRQFLSGAHQPTLMVLMVQKEVAERITTRDGKESILSISVKAYGKPEIVRKVPAGCFYPKPKVDSAVIKISGISKNFFKEPPLTFPLAKGERKGVEEKFFELVKKGFGQKRKMLINNLKISPEIFNKCNIPQKVRAENVSLGEWKCLLKGYPQKTADLI